MHETNSSLFIGYVDSNAPVNPVSNRVTGWVVSTANNLIAPGDIEVIDPDTNQKVSCVVNMTQRPDVQNVYNGGLKFLHSGFDILYPSSMGTLQINIGGNSVFTVVNPSKPENLDNIIRLNKNTKPGLIVVDNFYQDPDKVREYALKQEFKHNELYHKGARTEKIYIPSWAKDEFSRLLNKEVKEFVGATGVFQYCVAKDNVVYHYDTQEYAAMVYLSPDAPLQTGTQTFRSKITGLHKAATQEDADRFKMSVEELDSKSFNGNNFYDRHNMDLVDSVANIYNRLVIFDARTLHAATSYYGDTKLNSRLFHLYFFNC